MAYKPVSTVQDLGIKSLWDYAQENKNTLPQDNGGGVVAGGDNGNGSIVSGGGGIVAGGNGNGGGEVITSSGGGVVQPRDVTGSGQNVTSQTNIDLGLGRTDATLFFLNEFETSTQPSGVSGYFDWKNKLRAQGIEFDSPEEYFDYYQEYGKEIPFTEDGNIEDWAKEVHGNLTNQEIALKLLGKKNNGGGTY